MRDVTGVILGGGRGSRLFPLTQYRCKPAVPIGGKYRLIDIPISNCIHSDVKEVYVLTQFNSASLHRHISGTYRFDSFSDGFVEVLAAEQTMENTHWYQGTADAVRKQLRRILSRRGHQVLVLSGDHLYRMNYQGFVDEHRQREADVSIAVKPVTREEAPGLGILKIDGQGRVIDFVEKPQTEAELDSLRLSTPPGQDPEALYLASMGIYVFDPQVLTSLLLQDDLDDFGKHLIPEAIAKVDVYAHAFEGYWVDIGTIRSFYRANLDLANPIPPFRLHEPGEPVYTHQRYLDPSQLESCNIGRALIAEGCRMVDAVVEQSVVGVRSVVGAGARIRDSVLMGADAYESAADSERNAALGIPDIGIGAGSVIQRAIIDKNARIGTNVLIENKEGEEQADGEGYYIRDGIVVVPKDAVIHSGTRV